jgi:hypothetical protein
VASAANTGNAINERQGMGVKSLVGGVEGRDVDSILRRHRMAGRHAMVSIATERCSRSTALRGLCSRMSSSRRPLAC